MSQSGHAQETIIGHESQIEYLRRVLKTRKIHQAYVFTGPDSIGKRLIGAWFSQRLLCQNSDLPESCACASCRAFETHIHPDFFPIEPGAAVLGISEIRELIGRIRHAPVQSDRLVTFIPDADRMSESAMNGLLKTLEEPHQYAVFILTTSRPELLLPTVRSRCQQIRFSALPNTTLFQALVRRAVPNNQAMRLATLSNGSPGRAIAWLEQPESLSEIEQIISDIGKLSTSSSFDRFTYVKEFLGQNDLENQRASARSFIGLWLTTARDTFFPVKKGANRILSNKGNAQKTARSIRRGLASLQILRSNVSPSLILNSLLLSYER